MIGSPPRAPLGVLGSVATLAVAVAIGACSGSPIVPTATFIPGEASETASGAPSAPATLEPPSPEPSVAAPTPAGGGPTPAATSTGGGGTTGSQPPASVQPAVTSFSIVHSASCTSTNGTSSVGQIHLSWKAVGTSGVRLSIDPPSADVAYDYGYADYPATGSAEVPFACGAPNRDSKGAYHLYVLTTLHDSGYAMYRYAKVYEATPAAS
ncbi:MAG TPA: hypothetical protein VFW20_02515 [Candidatus Limnocylindrales bacterium]|nr:hypothetical protein [Candidatus Limnocylindrales bacterium]